VVVGVDVGVAFGRVFGVGEAEVVAVLVVGRIRFTDAIEEFEKGLEVAT